MKTLLRIPAGRARVFHADPLAGRETEVAGQHYLNIAAARWIELPPRSLELVVFFGREEAIRVVFEDEHDYTEALDRLSGFTAPQGHIR